MKTKLVLMGVGAALVLSGIWFFLLWSPQGENIDKAKAEKAASDQRASGLQVRLTHLQKLEANSSILERDRALLATAMPSSDQLDAFILDVNDRAAKAGVAFVSVSPQQPAAATAAPGAAAGAPTAIGLQIQVTGTYHQVLFFMEQLRDGSRLVTVENFALSKGAEGGAVSASIGGRMFVSPPTAAAPTAAPTTPSA